MKPTKLILSLLTVSLLISIGVFFLFDAEEDELVLNTEEVQKLAAWENHPDPLLAKLAKSAKKKVKEKAKKIKKEVKEEVQKLQDPIHGVGERKTDSVAPLILEAKVYDITETSAKFYIKTNEPTKLATFGPDESDSVLQKDRAITFTGLNPATPYSFKFNVSDSFNNVTVGGPITFFTLAPPSTTVNPQLTSVNFFDITQTSVKVTVSFNKISKITLSAPNLSPVASSELALQTTLILYNLAPNTTYNLDYKIVDFENKETTGGPLTFSTLTPPPADTTPPTITIGTITKTSNSITVPISTNEPATHQLSWLSQTTSSVGLVSSSALTATGLTEGTIYSFTVTATDASGNVATVNTSAATMPPADTTPPSLTGWGGITGSATYGQIINSNEPATRKIWMSTNSNVDIAQPPSVVSTNLTAEETLTVTGLTESTHYYTKFSLTDAAGNTSVYPSVTGGGYSIATADDPSTPPLILNLTASISASTTVSNLIMNVKWNTGNTWTANNKVWYSNNPGVVTQTPTANVAAVFSYTTDGYTYSADISNVTSGTTYYYKAQSTDQWGNTATSPEQSFTIP